MAGEAILVFGAFTLSRSKKLLLEGDKPVRLGSRALELLIALVERAGEIVSREQLEAIVWPQTIVEETSLRAHISALRKALSDGQNGARFIANIPGRGYCFVYPVAAALPQMTRPSVDVSSVPRHNLPARLNAVLGRGDVVSALTQMFPARRLVTVTGPGGMGKTTVAVAAAENLVARYKDGTRFVDFSPVSDPALVVGTVAAAFELSTASADPTSALCSFLCDRHVLIVLDNCEHLIDAVADLAERLLRGAPGVSIIATSREALNVEGEWAYRLGSLATPPESPSLTAAQALSFSAVELFMERARGLIDGFELADGDAPLLGDLCRRLDGLPLAIEFAAARVDSLGLHGLMAGLDDRLQLLSRGRRTAMPRHRTLRALLDWSYTLLSADEQAVFCRLAVFRTAFTQEAACAVAADDSLGSRSVIDCIMNLVAKSLICVDASGEELTFRHLESTRAYALEKLGQGEQLALAVQRHATYMLSLMSRAEGALAQVSRATWKETYCRVIDDIRNALDWSFSPGGDTALGVTLTAASLLPIFELGLHSELIERIHRALSHAHLLSPPLRRIEMRLNAVLCMHAGVSTQADRKLDPLMGHTLALAELVDDRNARIDAAFGVWVGAFGKGDYAVTETMALRIAELARDAADPPSTLLSVRLQAQTRHFLGDHEKSRQFAEIVLRQPDVPMHPGQTSPIPHRVSMGILLARIKWLEGFPDQALALAESCVMQAVDRNLAAMSQALGMAACPIALWRGDHAMARVFVDRLRGIARQMSSDYWQGWASTYDAILVEREEAAPQRSFDEDNGLTGFGDRSSKLRDCAGTLLARLVDSTAIARVEAGSVGWCAPEILRAHGENLLLAQHSASVLAESFFVRAIELASTQRALSWELRAALSLARLWHRQDRHDDAHRIVSTTLARFTEGGETLDLRSARQFIAQLDVDAGQPAIARAQPAPG